MSAPNLPAEAGTVVIGAGIVGCSAAYHLTALGRDDVVVVDSGPLPTTGGSSSHAPGIMFQTEESREMTKFAAYGRDLYSELTDGDGDPLYNEVGGIEVARTDERMDFLQRRVEWARAWGIADPQILDPAEVAEKLPLVDPEVIRGGFYSPTDGQVSGVKACTALAREAESGGAEFFGHTRVTDLLIEDGAIEGVDTEYGTVEADEVLAATNIWSAKLNDLLDYDFPVAPVEHQYTITESLDELSENSQIADDAALDQYREVTGDAAERLLIGPDRPILRDQDNAMYFRTHGDAYGIGSYNHEPIVPDPDELAENTGDGQGSTHEFTEKHLNEATHPDRPHKAPRQASDELLPATAGRDLEFKYNGMFSYAPNGEPVLGEVPTVDGLWAAMAIWITHAGGAGHVIAEWMENGVPRLDGERLDLHEMDVSRFQPHEGAKEYYLQMAGEQYRQVYNIVHPEWVWDEPRDIRRSPFYGNQADLGAEFWASGGWEAPEWYDANEGLLAEYGDEVPNRDGWEAEYWSPVEGAEHLAVRDRVGLFDQTSFIKIEIEGPNALDFVQRLFTGDMDVSAGRVKYTLMLAEDGGVRADLTVTRFDDDRFLVLTGGGAGGREDLHWIRTHAPDSVTVTDRTSELCGVGVWGPDARNLLQSITEEDLSDDAHGYFRARRITVGSVPALALRVSYVGELGWELYAPTEYGAKLWERLWEAGQDHGVVAAGDGAMDTMRIEKGFRLWGEDLLAEHDPYEAGLGFAVDLDKDEFIGKGAVEQSAEEGVDRKVACLTLDDEEAVVLADRPVVDPDSEEVLGYVHSAEYGYSVGSTVVYTYLPADYAEAGVGVDVLYEGERYPATVRDEPLFDPEGERVRS